MVRVVPDVAGITKVFDYLVPDDLSGAVGVGTPVRVVLGRRRVNGWVVEEERSTEGLELRPLLAARGWGPPPAVVELCRWAAWRWAGPLCRLLGAASPIRLVRSIPAGPAGARGAASGLGAPGGPGAAGSAASELVGDAFAGGTTVVRLAPAHDPLALVEAGARLATGPGGVLVLVPARRQAEALSARLRSRGHLVALLPEQWALSRAGGAVTVGTRSAAWAPLPSLSAAVVLDAHDQAYHEERAPTWIAWQVVAERARRHGVPCALVSPCPTLELLACGPLVVGSRREERAGWPLLEIVDRRAEDPRSGLYSERLVQLVRWAAAERGRRVLCVLNRTGRARLLACRACGELARCEHCGAATERIAPAPGAGAGEVLGCRRCGAQRPEVCGHCGSQRMRVLRTGVSRVREELESLTGAPVAEVTAQSRARGTDEATGQAAVVVGTEAVLHGGGRADAVAFLDFDTELLAPRLRAGEQALALLARGAALVGGEPAWGSAAPAGVPVAGERAPGRLLVQTRLPGHPVLAAAASADPGTLALAEQQVRSELRLPPFRAQAVVSGAAAPSYGPALAQAAPPDIEVRGPVEGTWSVLAPDHAALADFLAAVARPPGRLRVEVDPVRA